MGEKRIYFPFGLYLVIIGLFQYTELLFKLIQLHAMT